MLASSAESDNDTKTMSFASMEMPVSQPLTPQESFCCCCSSAVVQQHCDEKTTCVNETCPSSSLHYSEVIGVSGSGSKPLCKWQENHRRLYRIVVLGVLLLHVAAAPAVGLTVEEYTSVGSAHLDRDHFFTRRRRPSSSVGRVSERQTQQVEEPQANLNNETLQSEPEIQLESNSEPQANLKNVTGQAQSKIKLQPESEPLAKNLNETVKAESKIKLQSESEPIKANLNETVPSESESNINETVTSEPKIELESESKSQANLNETVRPESKIESKIESESESESESEFPSASQPQASSSSPASIWPLSTREVIGLLLATLGLTIAAGGGVGGGGILIPIYILVLHFSPRFAIPLSNVTVFGGAVANTLLNVQKRHPHADRPLIDWDLILMMEPLTISGALLGSFVNKMVPEKWLVVLLVALLSFTAYNTLKRAVKMYRKESQCWESLTKRGKGGGEANGRDSPAALKQQASMDVSLSSVEDGRDDHDTLASSCQRHEECRFHHLQDEHTAPSSASSASQASSFSFDDDNHAMDYADFEEENGNSNNVLRDRPATPVMHKDGGRGSRSSHVKTNHGRLLSRNESYDLELVEINVTKTGDKKRDANQEKEHVIHQTKKSSPRKGGGAYKSVSSKATSGGSTSRDGILPSATLETILQEEKTAPKSNIVTISCMFIVVLITNVMKGGGAFSPLGIECGSGLFWSAEFLTNAWVIFIFVRARSYLVERTRIKRSVDYPYAEGDIVWDEQTTLLYPVISCLAGYFAGMFGVGGGIVKGPLMLAMGVHPAVASATSACMILFTSFTATTSYGVFGLLIPDYALLVVLVGFLATLLGQTVMSLLLKKYKRNSYIAFSIGFVVLLSAVFMTLESVLSLNASSSSDVGSDSGGLCSKVEA